MKEKERAFVVDTVGEGEALEIVQQFALARFPYLVCLETDVDGFRLLPLGPGDRVYLRDVKPADVLIVHGIAGECHTLADGEEDSL